MKGRLVFLSGAVLCLAPASFAQRVLTVRMHPSLEAPIKRIVDEYRKTHKNVRVEFVEAGVAADILLGPSSMVKRQQGARLFAIDRLVVVAPKSSSRVEKFSHLGLTMRLALPSSKTPDGQLAQSVLERARSAYGRDWWANTKRNTTVSANSSAQAVNMVQEEKADAAIVLSSSATDLVKVVSIPSDLGASIEHYAYGRRDSLAQSFVEYLYSKGNQQRLVGSGFSSPLSPVGEIIVTYPSSMTRFFTAALASLVQQSVTATDEGGKTKSYKGASVAAILTGSGRQAKFIGADGYSRVMSINTLRRGGAALVAMGDGNYRVVFSGQRLSDGVRWLRRIEVK